MGQYNWGSSGTPKKPSVIQVPDSSPASSNNGSPKSQFQHTRLFGNVKPKPLYDENGKQINKPSSTSNLREKFAFNGSDLLKKNNLKTDAQRDLEILRNQFPTLSFGLVKAVYTSKADGNLKEAKQKLVALVENRKKLQASRPSPAPLTSPTKNGAIEIISSPDVSPQKLSSKVILNKTKTISEKYSHNLKRVPPPQVIPIPDEPQPKKRRLVRGSRNSPSTGSDTDVMVTEVVKKEVKGETPPSTAVNLEDEEEDEPILNDDFSDSDVDESIIYHNNNDVYAEKVLNFFNNVEEREIIDVTSCEAEIAKNIVLKRPFKSIVHLESFNFKDTAPSKRRQKTDGEIIAQKAESVLRGYDAVESLVQECNVYSEAISKEISKWGVQVHGVTDELEIVNVQIDDVEDDEDRVSTVKRDKNNYHKEKPKLLADEVELKNYQQVGINWLNLLYKNKLSCILADEMGLGKTCQVISFISYLKEQDIQGPHLVVVPSSTLENWMREFNKFSPSLVVEPYYGTQAEREEMRDVLSEKMDQIDVIVTTYNLATGGKEDQSFLKHAGFNIVVYDEGHMLKNSASERFQKLVKIRAKFRLLLTGTPLQNNLRELMSLLEFILPGIFVSKKEDLKAVFTQKATTKDSKKGYNPLLSERAISNAKKMMAPFILRRRKDQVLQHLPAKHNTIKYFEMTPTQADIYEREVQNGIKLRHEKRSKVVNILMNLRKAAIHPLLFRNLYTNEKLQIMSKEIMKEDVYQTANQQYIYEDMEVMNDFELSNLCDKFPSIQKFALSDEEFLNSGKIEALEEVLNNIIIHDGKVLIFSLFTQVLDILERVLSKWSIKFLRLDGSTAVDTRQDIIDKFYESQDIPVFLLSTKAGGFGINLVCANNVVIFDQSFNPHDDKQAEDRAHRVGQERVVNVVRLICKGTIEESMHLIAQNKLELDQSMSGEQIENKAAEVIGKMIFDGEREAADAVDKKTNRDVEAKVEEIDDNDPITID